MTKNKILSLGTMYADINCLAFPFDKALFANRETVGKSYQLDVGGSALNFAKVAAQLELDIAFLGKSGTDPMTHVVTELIKQNNITPYLVQDASVQTNIAIHYIHEDGSSIMTSCGNANQSLTLADIESQLAKVLNEIDYLYLGGVFKLKQLLPDLKHVVKLAKEKKVKLVLDHGRINNTVTENDLKHFYSVFPFIDIYLPSSDEFLSVWKSQSIEDGITKINNIASPQIVIKQAERGAIGIENNQLITVDPYDVKVLNTVGAGDSFNAGFLRAITDGQDFKSAIQFGCAVAATKISTTENLSLSKVKTLIANS